MTRNIKLPCKECISYAICYNQEIIDCYILWAAYAAQKESLSMSSFVKDVFPNVKSLRNDEFIAQKKVFSHEIGVIL